MGALVGVATACGSQGSRPCLAMVESSRNSISTSDYLVYFVACTPSCGCAPAYPHRATLIVCQEALSISILGMDQSRGFVIPEGLFNWCLLVSVVCLLVLSPIREALPPIPVVANLFYAFDLVQFGSFVMALLLLWMWLRAIGIRPGRRYLALFLVLIAFVVEAWLIGDSFGVHMFGFRRPISPFSEPPITQFMKQFESSSPLNSAPSDFAVRQWAITLIGFFVLDQPGFVLKKRIPLKIFFSISAVYVICARLFRLAHTPADIGVSIAMTSFGFWSIALLIAIALGLSLSRDIESRYAILCCVTVGYFILVSNNPLGWIFILFAFPVIAWISATAARVWNQHHLVTRRG